jgi:RHS repeat-associated protein
VIYLIRADHIGRPAFATTLAGTKVWSAVYPPFGGVHVTTGAPIDARFPGQWFQTEAGLHQNWMRDYDPTTGRYIETDPLGLVDGASVYGYARQSPVVYTDPRGEDPSSPANPNGRIPGGPWTWSPDPSNGRGGTWQNGRGATATWDKPGSHWDVDNGKGDRQRYNRHGKPISPKDAHDKKYNGPPRFPFPPRAFPLLPLYLPPMCILNNTCGDLAELQCLPSANQPS